MNDVRLNLSEVANHLNCCEVSVKKLVKDYDFPFLHRKPELFFSKNAVDNYVNANQIYKIEILNNTLKVSCYEY